MIKNKLTLVFLAFSLSISTNVNAIESEIFDENKPAFIKMLMPNLSINFYLLRLHHKEAILMQLAIFILTWLN